MPARGRRCRGARCASAAGRALVSPESRAPEPPARARARRSPAAPALGQPAAQVLGQPAAPAPGQPAAPVLAQPGGRLECRRGSGARHRVRAAVPRLTGTLPRMKGQTKEAPLGCRSQVGSRPAKRGGAASAGAVRGLGWCPVAKQPGVAAPERSEQPHDDLLERVPGDSRMAHASVCVLDQQRVDPARTTPGSTDGSTSTREGMRSLTWRIRRHGASVS